MITEIVRRALHHGWTGSKVPEVLSRISIRTTIGKDIKTLKNTIWKVSYDTPRNFTTTSCIAYRAKANSASAAPRMFDFASVVLMAASLPLDLSGRGASPAFA
jgi:hypothetical protein